MKKTNNETRTPGRFISGRKLEEFKRALRTNEKAPSTIEKYIRDVKRLQKWLDGKELTRERVIKYKESLMNKSASVNSINSYLVSANSFFELMGWGDLKVKTYRVQQETAQADEAQMTKSDYKRLLQAARRQGNVLLFLILQALASTGMRISELKFITVESIRSGTVQVYNKGKVRRILLTDALRAQLDAYVKTEQITEGVVFRNRKGEAISRTTVWRWMKKLCKNTAVETGKVFPHNLRKLFATELYDVDKDIAHVADVLGHYNVNTTRRYIRKSYSKYRRELESLGLVSRDWDKKTDGNSFIEEMQEPDTKNAPDGAENRGNIRDETVG